MPHRAKKNCQGCATEITAEQIVQREAGLVGGVLLCPACVNRKREELLQARHAGSGAGASQPAQQAAAASPVSESQGSVYLPPDKKVPDVTDQTLSLVSEEEVPPSGRSKNGWRGGLGPTIAPIGSSRRFWMTLRNRIDISNGLRHSTRRGNPQAQWSRRSPAGSGPETDRAGPPPYCGGLRAKGSRGIARSCGSAGEIDRRAGATGGRAVSPTG